jgi:Cu+-exporting ATPase
MPTLRDPVCGMCVPEEQCVVRRVYRGRTYAFCCARCGDAFAADPERFVGGDADPDDAWRPASGTDAP